MEVNHLFEQAQGGSAFFELWVIDNADTDDADRPRVGVPRGHYYDKADGHFIRLKREEAKALYDLCSKESPGTEWAMCYDDQPNDGDPYVEFTNDRGAPKQYALSYSGRYWEVLPEQVTYYCMDTIYDFCMNDTGAVHYFEKEEGAWHLVM